MARELQEVSYTFMSTGVDGAPTPEGRWTQGESFDGRSSFRVEKMAPRGSKPKLANAPSNTGAQASQMGVMHKIAETIRP
jgi:Mn-containing catalase